MITFEGKNKNFSAQFDCENQVYIVYYKGRILTKKYCFRDIKSYLD